MTNGLESVKGRALELKSTIDTSGGTKRGKYILLAVCAIIVIIGAIPSLVGQDGTGAYANVDFAEWGVEEWKEFFTIKIFPVVSQVIAAVMGLYVTISGVLASLMSTVSKLKDAIGTVEKTTSDAEEAKSEVLTVKKGYSDIVLKVENLNGTVSELNEILSEQRNAYEAELAALKDALAAAISNNAELVSNGYAKTIINGLEAAFGGEEETESKT